MNVAAKLSNVIVRDEDDHPVELGTLWHHHTVVLAFIRHFG